MNFKATAQLLPKPGNSRCEDTIQEIEMQRFYTRSHTSTLRQVPSEVLVDSQVL